MGWAVKAAVTILSNETLRGVLIPFFADLVLALFQKSKTDPKLKADLESVGSAFAGLKAESTTEERDEIAKKLHDLRK